MTRREKRVAICMTVVRTIEQDKCEEPKGTEITGHIVHRHKAISTRGTQYWMYLHKYCQLITDGIVNMIKSAIIILKVYVSSGSKQNSVQPHSVLIIIPRELMSTSKEAFK